MNKKVTIAIIVSVIILVIIMSASDANGTGTSIFGNIFKDNHLTLLVNPDNKDVEDDLMAFAKKNKIDLEIEYADDLEIVDMLEENSELYDGVWLSNSVWLYMLNGVKTSESKSIYINPAIFGVKKSKAKELGFINGEINNRDIIEAIRAGKLKYVMTSVTKTNTGLISYLGFLNALSGSPEILTAEMLDNKSLENELKALFSGVERVSGSSSFLEDMFLNSNEYEAVIATESSLIRINKQLEREGKEQLYLLYPNDGVAVNDSPLAFIDHGDDKKESFLKIQSFLLSEEEQKNLEKTGKRTWYGGIKSDADTSSFKKEWGIDTTKYLNAMKYPSKDVMNKAIMFYINALRKPSAIAFCLDYSGSMDGEGEEQLVEAMSFILDYEKAGEEFLQFSENDTIYVLPFSDSVKSVWSTKNGKMTSKMLNDIKSLYPVGGTNIYGCASEALELVDEYNSNTYTKTVILMTDGESNRGSYEDLRFAYNKHPNIPVYSIMFGEANEYELDKIASLTNAKVFDGRTSLIRAFKEVRSYN